MHAASIRHAMHDPKLQPPHAAVSKIVLRCQLASWPWWHKLQNLLTAELMYSLEILLM